MRTLYLLLCLLLFCSPAYSHPHYSQQNQNVTQWHSVYQATLKTNAKSALSLLQSRYHTAKYDSEKLYVSGLIYEYMSNMKQPYYGNSQGRNNAFATLEAEYILALNERRQGSYDASVKSFISLRNKMKQSASIEGEALMNYQLCYTLNQQGRYHKAHFFCSSLESHFDNKHQENFPKDLSLRVIANNYNFRGDYEKSISVYRRLLANMPYQSDPSGVYNDVGNLLAELGQFEQSEQYLIQALLARQQDGTPVEVAQVEHSLAAMYAKAKDFDKAITHYKNSLTILEHFEYPYGQGLVYLGLSSAEAESGNVEEALKYVNQALGLGERYENNHLQTEAHLAAGFAYLKSLDAKTAIEHANSALRLSTDNSRPLLQAKAQLLLSKAYQALNNFQAALLHYEAYSTLELANRDSKNMKAMEALDLTKNEYEYDLNLARLNIERNLKQTEFEKLTEQKTIYNFIVFCLVVLLILTLVVQRQARKKARLDSLTSALNRSTSIETIKRQATKTDGELRYVLALVDLDNFKSINDAYGHPAGDLVLKQVCQKISTKLNKDDFIGRLSGEEFVLLLKNVDEIDVPFRIQSLHKTISELSIKTEKNEEVVVTASLAYLATSNPLTHFDELYSILDQALSQAKSGGSNVLVDAYDQPINLSKG
ncbi:MULTISPECIES: tetratricopeptide repeat-containing diguanylate cyclase [Vibrio]|uniref:diguanylate cyclase n=1 Tax=Vibrio natriegens NBRC 15636 = ATCC 14048 = DSM 759 TaxID=1219067 RepID=A0AAN0Y2Q6_VIBNA|nr:MULTISPECIES: tetratricopeptide repeat-containing diguanylate cyclase [Vibrio]AEX22040.1 GGDEF family protein [Vibrio sp. EJY3]ALR15452.1 diguanylate cyclase [Vibrio natriegens NBRC 15636 = ATCC 14048 = DSM 759]ANQ12689.1 diguanylate cyclase [Vibrio natriegens NBRC 15636 = ATCC 14048 = DSM 759]EPM38294.1 diguanylate cyclase [Vibrio natriegens NBRC 15636 = ATCC 14048 = DSM 759]MDX6027087.1 tetratricopeptide repeat-containing diguanylate cyclase [Vibrio natriegens NBRC 15636 = ATCC 14048 = DS